MQRQLKPLRKRFWRMATKLADLMLLACTHMAIACRQCQRNYIPEPGVPLLIVPGKIADDGQTCSYLVVSAEVAEITSSAKPCAAPRSKWRARRGHGY